MSLKNFAKGLSAVLACLMTVSFLLSPADLRIDAHEAGTDSENTVIEVSNTSTETTDVLNEEEKVTAHDMTVQVNEITNIEEWIEKIDFDKSAVDVRFDKSEPPFESGTPETYKITYTVIPYSGKPSYSVSREIKVESPAAGTDEENKSESGDEGDSENDTDPLPDKKEETVTDKDSEDKTEADAEDKADEKSEDETADAEESEEVKATENSNSKAQTKATPSVKVTITEGAKYYYYKDNNGMSDGDTESDRDFFTRLYKIEYDTIEHGKKIFYSYCSQPSKTGPIGNGFPGTGNFGTFGANDMIAKILFYGADAQNPGKSPADADSFFALTSYQIPGGPVVYPNTLTPAQRFIATHMALGKENDKTGWANHSNQFAQNYANALHYYASRKNIGLPTQVPTLAPIGGSQEVYGIENGKAVVKSKVYRFSAHPSYSISATLKDGMSIDVVNTPEKSYVKKGNEVTIYGGTEFRLVAPDKQNSEAISEEFTFNGNYSTYSMHMFYPDKSQTGKSFQDLVMFYTEADNKNFSIKITADWICRSEVRIAKVDKDDHNILLGGASFQLTDKAGNVLREWTSSSEGAEVFTSEDLVPGNEYFIKELKAPEGYVLVEDAGKFTMPERTTAAPVTQSTPEAPTSLKIVEVENAKRKVQISKTDITTGKELPGAWLMILDPEEHIVVLNNEALAWRSKAEPKIIEGLPVGKYILREVIAPKGYVKHTDVPFEVTDTAELQRVEMKDEVTRIAVQKVSSRTGEPVKGAMLSIRDRKGNIVKGIDGKDLQFESGSEPVEITHLPYGVYWLREDEVPAGYVKADDVKFVLSSRIFEKYYEKNSNVTNVDEIKPLVLPVTMKEDSIKVQFSKQDITNGKELPGATLSIRTPDGKIVLDQDGDELEWVSTNEPHMVYELPAGKYILREELAPEGYLIANDVNFTVEETGDIQTVVMKDEVTRVHVQKISSRTGDPVVGAKLSIRTSDDGESDTNIVKDRNGEPLTFESESAPVEITHLPYGEYWLHEDEAPAGYVKADPVQFILKAEDFEYNGQQKPEGDEQKPEGDEQKPEGDEQKPEGDEQKPEGDEQKPEGDEQKPEDGEQAPEVKEPFALLVTMKDDSIKVQFSKRDITTQEELPGATLSILYPDKTYVLDQDGNKLTWVSTNEPHMVYELPAGNYILREEIAPEGYLIANDVEFTVTETGDIQTVVMEDDYTKVDIVKIDDMDEPVIGALLRLETEDGELIKEFTSGEEAVRFDRLPVGKYVLTELEAPEGYDMAEPIVFEVKAEAGVQTVTMIDEILIDTGGEEEPDPGKPGNPGEPSNPGQPDNPKPSTPAPSAPNTSKTSPATATETGWVTWIVLAAAAFILLVVLTVLRKKTEKN